jgi:hypothetical protein
MLAISHVIFLDEVRIPGFSIDSQGAKPYDLKDKNDPLQREFENGCVQLFLSIVIYS